jgi:hypothetical protein
MSGDYDKLYAAYSAALDDAHGLREYAEELKRSAAFMETRWIEARRDAGGAITELRAAREAIKGLLEHLPQLWGDSVVEGQFTLTVEANAVYAALDALAKNVIPTGTSGECPACFGPWSAHAEECPNRHITRNPEERPEISTQPTDVWKALLTAAKEADAATNSFRPVYARLARAIDAAEASLQRDTQSETAEFAIYEGDEFFADVSGPRERAWCEAMSYASQVDNPRIEEVVRTPAPMGELPPLSVYRTGDKS